VGVRKLVCAVSRFGVNFIVVGLGGRGRIESNMKTIKITVADVIDSQRTCRSSGQLERVEEDVGNLRDLVKAMLGMFSTQQLLDIYVTLNGSNEHYEHYDLDNRYMDEISFGVEDSK
jgi:hypothetical protein